MRLTLEQERLLDTVRAAHQAKVNATMDAEREARALVARKVDAAVRAESMAVRSAIDGGVPPTRVGKEGLLSKDYGTVARSLAVTADDVAAMDAAVEHMVSERFRALTPDEVPLYRAPVAGVTVVRVDWPDYLPPEGSPLHAYGQRVPLHGFVYNTGPRKNRYSVLVDDDLPAWEAVGKLGALQWAVEEDTFADAADRIVNTL